MAITNVMTQSLISAGNTMKQIKLQQSVRKELKGKAGVLDSEIKRDEASGADTTAKREELAETEKKVGGAKTKVISESNHATKVPHIDEKITPPTSSEVSVSVSEAGGHSLDVKA